VNYLESLRDAVQKAHGCTARHVRSVPVKEVFRGQTIWDGTVEVFDLAGHPTAKRCYAWGHHAADAGQDFRIVTVLEIPPVASPVTAVRVSITGQMRRP
jgi:hypothetical protein